MSSKSLIFFWKITVFNRQKFGLLLEKNLMNQFLFPRDPVALYKQKQILTLWIQRFDPRDLQQATYMDTSITTF
jgi:hypothetical protein